MIKIDIRFTKIAPSTNEGLRIPMTSNHVYPDFHREIGSTAEMDGFNRLIITTPYYTTEEYAVSFELSGNDYLKMMARDYDESLRFWEAVEAVVMARLNNMISYINRHTW